MYHILVLLDGMQNAELTAPKRVHALSVAAACAALFPLAMLQVALAPPPTTESGGVSALSFGALTRYLFVSASVVVGQFYLQGIVQAKMSESDVAAYGLLASFAFAVLVDVVGSYGQSSVSAIVAFVLVYAGLHLTTRRAAKDKDGLAMYDNSKGKLGAGGGAQLVSARRVLKHIMEDRQSRKIFYFLSMNLVRGESVTFPPRGTWN